MTPKCIHCGALKLLGENLNYCHSGKINLPPIAPCPEIQLLLSAHTEQTTNFRSHIQKYNSPLAFASIATSLATAMFESNVHDWDSLAIPQTSLKKPKHNQMCPGVT